MYPVSDDYHNSVGSTSLNITVFDKLQFYLLENVILTTAIFKPRLPTEPR
jgi:hypothetical protein